MIYTPLTKKALAISFEAHKGQKDKSGMPYVYHPYELATQMESEAEVCVALLHDVVEDTEITFADLEAEGFSEEILEALKRMTHEDDVPYFDYIREIKKNPLATKVKMADLCHNSTESRLACVTSKDAERIQKYRKALAILAEEQEMREEYDVSNARNNPYRQFLAEVERGWKSAEEQGMTDIDEVEMLLGIKSERTELREQS